MICLVKEPFDHPADACDSHRASMGALIDGVLGLHPQTDPASVLAHAFRIQSEAMSHALPHPDAVRTFLRASGAMPTKGGQNGGRKPTGMPRELNADVSEDLEVVLELRRLSHDGNAVLAYRDAVAVARLCRHHLNPEVMAWLAMTGYSAARRSKVR